MLGPVKFLTIHCAATPEGRAVKAETVESWDIAKFSQKSYHLIIEIDGHVHRSLDDTELGCHVHLANHGNIGVCYVGGCDLHGNPKDTRTPMQRQALVNVVEEYKSKYPGIIVRGHRDWPNVHKACPSFDVHAWLQAEALDT